MQQAGLPQWLSGKETACNADDAVDSGSISVLGRSPEEENGNPLQYCCPENPMDKETWRSTAYGITKSQTGLN